MLTEMNPEVETVRIELQGKLLVAEKAKPAFSALHHGRDAAGRVREDLENR